MYRLENYFCIILHTRHTKCYGEDPFNLVTIVVLQVRTLQSLAISLKLHLQIMNNSKCLLLVYLCIVDLISQEEGNSNIVLL